MPSFISLIREEGRDHSFTLSPIHPLTLSPAHLYARIVPSGQLIKIETDRRLGRGPVRGLTITPPRGPCKDASLDLSTIEEFVRTYLV